MKPKYADMNSNLMGQNFSHNIRIRLARLKIFLLRSDNKKNSIGPILFLYYEESLVSSLCTITIRHLPWIGGDFKARMGHQIAFNLAKTGSNVFSQCLQFRVLFIRDFEPAIQNLFTSFKPILMLVWVTPISNLKYFLKTVK